MRRRVIFVVLDGVGIGALPDAADYGDEGSDTLGNLSRVLPLRLPHLGRLGLGNIAPLEGMPPVGSPLALPGRLASRSQGKDSTVGHWEHMGLVTARAFPTYPDGFPEDVITAFSRAIGRGVLGNKPASGTAIIAELGEEHLATGSPIVYTSADSVFQIAAHTEIVPLELLFDWCQTARSLLKGPHAVARVIARPFTGSPGAFVRTKDRRDFSLPPPGPTYLDLLEEAGVPVYGVGKIGEIFGRQGVSQTLKAATNAENLALVRSIVEGKAKAVRFDRGLLLTNLVEFDMVWGHRNDAEGFFQGLQDLDAALPGLLAALQPEDRLVLTADHGVDPTTPSTDHSREYVPLLVYPPPSGSPRAVYEGWFSDTGATTFRYLTGKEPRLEGAVIDELRPPRGWRCYTSTLRVPGPTPCVSHKMMPKDVEGARESAVKAGQDRAVPVRAGHEDAVRAAEWLAKCWGAAPSVALVLGSGQAAGFGGLGRGRSLAFGEIPGWRCGQVRGHPYQLLLLTSGKNSPIVVQAGRLHWYEGFDDGERQLMTRTLAAWGVKRLIVTTASGGVASGQKPGEVVLVRQVLDFLHLLPTGGPAVLEATPASLVRATDLSVAEGVHACVPGPHYETMAELDVLRRLGVATVSMSLADELLAARDTGIEVVALAVVVNVGDTSHVEVLAGAQKAADRLQRVVAALVGA